MIEINKDNYANFLSLNISAFSFASPGAMGEGGGVYILTEDKKMYHANFVHGDMSFEEILKVCPPLGQCKFGLFNSCEIPKGFAYFYMGAGNHLVVEEKYEVLFSDLQPFEIYQQWKDAIRNRKY